MRATRPLLVRTTGLLGSELRGALPDMVGKFESLFPPSLTKPRMVGREAEYPVTWADGSAADVRLLLAETGKNARFRARHEDGFNHLLSPLDTTQLVGLERDGGVEFGLEVGWGTVEVGTGPEQDLVTLAHRHEEAVGELVSAGAKVGMVLLGYGIQPRTSASVNLMSPRVRYQTMLECLGDDWLSFTVTASDQLHVDVAQDHVIPALNLSLLLSPAVIALCGNSPVFGGKESGVCCGREYLMQRCQRQYSRHGMPKAPFSSLMDWFHHISAMPFLMRPDPVTGTWTKIPSFVPFDQFPNPSWTDFLAHEHYVWHNSRPRSRQRTIELRAACQQPWADHSAASALQLGLVEGWDRLTERVVGEWFQGDWTQAWKQLRGWRKHAMRHGLRQQGDDASNVLTRGSLKALCEANDTPGMLRLIARCQNTVGTPALLEIGQAMQRADVDTILDALALHEYQDGVQLADTAGFLRAVLDACSEALERRGFGEAVLLRPLYERVERGENPAQTAVGVARQGGLKALLQHVRV